MKNLIRNNQFLPLILSSVFIVVSFQNCAPVQFAFNEIPVASQQDTDMPAMSCTFNGLTYQDGASVTAYESSSGSTCQSEIRVCHDGAFTGSFRYATCAPNPTASCLFNGQTITHGQEVTAFQNSTVPAGQTCVSERRSCNNGNLSGTYAFASCSPGQAASCLFNGQTIANGQTVTAYQSSSVSFGQSCAAEQRTCTNGTLSGSYQNSTCNPGQAASCLFNGSTVPHGQSVPAFLYSTLPAGQACVSQARYCNNGSLSGTYQYATCAPAQNASCLFNGQSVAHGQSINAFASSTVPAGSSCASQTRTCNNGQLSGSYGYSSCQTQQQAPTFSCTKSVYTCGETIRCSAQGSDINLKACDAYGCYPLLGRADWTYLGNGSFSYARIDDNGSQEDAQYWGVQDSNGLRSPMIHVTTKSCAPKFSCSTSYVPCGGSVTCSASGTDSNLMACSPDGCFPLMGRANWSYQGDGNFIYNWVNNNTNTSAVSLTWFSKNTNGYVSPQSNVTFGACR